MERQHFLALLAFLLVGTTVKPTSGASCEPNPCGQGAECQSMSTIAVCLCPPGTSGDPFESCQPTSVMATSTSTSLPSSTESILMSTSTLASPSFSSGAYTTMPSTSIRSSPMSKSSEMTTRQSTDYAMSTPQESRHTHAYTTPAHQRSGVPMTDNGGYGYRTTYNDGSYYRQPSSNFYNSYNEPMRGEDRHRYHTETNPHYSSHATHMLTDRPSYRHRDRDSYYQDSGNQDYMRRVVSVPETNYDRVYDERYAGSSRDYVKDPMGLYSNCKTVNGILVCADTKDQNMADSPRETQQDSMYKSGSTSNSNYYYQSRPREEDYRAEVMPSSSSYHGRDRDRDDIYRQQEPIPSSNSYHHDSSMRNRNKYRDDTLQSSSPYADTQSSKTMMMSQPHGRNPGDIVHEFIIKSPDTPSYLETTPPLQNPRPYHQDQAETVAPVTGDPEQCRQFCGENSICRQIRGRPICGCPEGYTGDASVRCEPAEDQMRMKNRCQKHTDCSDKEICDQSQCIDPCSNGTGASEDRNEISRSSQSYRRSKQSSFYDAPRRGEITAPPTAAPKKTRKNFCGPNTKCHVIDHTPLCGCLDGFTGNPYTRCVRSGK